MPPQNLERTDEICIAGSPLPPRRVSEIRADAGGLGGGESKTLGECSRPESRCLNFI